MKEQVSGAQKEPERKTEDDDDDDDEGEKSDDGGCSCWPSGRLSMEGMVNKAVRMLEHFEKKDVVAAKLGDNAIPNAFLRHAKGLAFLTAVKTGFFCGAHVGTGIVVAQTTAGQWSYPAAFRLGGLGFGFLFGASVVDLLLIFNTHAQMKAFASKTQVRVGGDLQLTVGPVGRDAQATLAAGDAGVTACYSYSFSKGLFIGLSVDAGVMRPHRRENGRFFGTADVTVEAILNGEAQPLAPCKDAERLRSTLAQLASPDAPS
eukprot:EG_transcript_15516